MRGRQTGDFSSHSSYGLSIANGSTLQSPWVSTHGESLSAYIAALFQLGTMVSFAVYPGSVGPAKSSS